jgi:hypothetical protein
VPNRPQGGWIYTGSTHIPEIHGVTFALGHVSGNKRLFLPVRTDFEVNKKRDRVFVTIGYEKKNEARLQISRFYKGARKDFFKDLGEENGWRPAAAALRRDLEASRCRTRELNRPLQAGATGNSVSS